MVGVGLVALAAALFAINGTVSKLALTSGLSTLRLVEIRSTGAALLLCLLVLSRNRQALRPGRAELGFLLVYGVLGVAMVQWLYFVAISRIAVGVALLIQFTAPLLIALWVRFVVRRPVAARVWPALGLVLAGLALVAQVWTGPALDPLGLVAAVLAAAVLGAYYLMGEHGMRRREPVSLAACGFAVAALFWAVLLPWWSYPFGALGTPVPVTGTVVVPAGVLVAWNIVLGTVVPFSLVLAGIKRIGPTRAGLIGTLEPVLGGIVAWAVLGEHLAGAQLAGALVVLAGIVLAETARTPVDAGAEEEPLVSEVPVT
jgi:drug/metabolite transporter (DMT)-like permease